MTINGNQLLSALGSGIVPGGGIEHDTRHLDEPSFDDILARVLDGKPSGIGVELTGELRSDLIPVESLERVGQAADLAAIEGIQRAVVDLGDSLVRVDVLNRMVEAQFEPGAVEVISGVDGFVSVRSSEPLEGAAQLGTDPVGFNPARGVRNASLVWLLSE